MKEEQFMRKSDTPKTRRDLWAVSAQRLIRSAAILLLSTCLACVIEPNPSPSESGGFSGGSVDGSGVEPGTAPSPPDPGGTGLGGGGDPSEAIDQSADAISGSSDSGGIPSADAGVATDGETDSETDGETTQPPDCVSYCSAVSSACTEHNAVYESQADCLKFCEVAQWMPGTNSATEDNTLGCRVKQSELALTKPETACPAAGPTGGGSCGSWCEVYCHLSPILCPDNTPDSATCEVTCSTFPHDAPWNSLSGNSVQCRLNQMLLSEGCPHAAADGGMFCMEEPKEGI